MTAPRWHLRTDPGYFTPNVFDENRQIVHILDIDHRSELYHRPQN